MKRTFLTLLTVLSAVVAVAGCGAPTKSAGEVSHLFDGEAASLQSKQNSVCRILESRDEAPTTKGLSVSLDGCVDAGRAALDYKKIDAFYFRGLEDIEAEKNSKVIRKSVRSQVWLNKSLLGFAGAISKQLKKKAENGDNTGEVTLSDSSGGGLQNVAKTKITVIKEPKIDPESFSFSTLINFNVSGIINADHDIQIDGRLIENSFAVTVQTTEDRKYEQSLIKNFSAVILIIPHASDIYMDLFVDLNIHNPGLETLVKSQIDSFLSTGLKSAIDSLMAL